MLESQLKAAQSHFSAKRDEAKANLDAFMSGNTSCSNPQQEINFWLKELSDALGVLSTINIFIENSKPKPVTES